MNLTQKPFSLGRSTSAAIVGCFLASCLLANVLLAESSPTNSVAVWPFTPPADLKPPQVRHADRVTNGIDNFILAALEEKGLTGAVDEPIHVRDVHATLLNLPGLDDEHLPYHYAGRIRRLTEIRGNVLKQIIA